MDKYQYRQMICLRNQEQDAVSRFRGLPAMLQVVRKPDPPTCATGSLIGLRFYRYAPFLGGLTKLLVEGGKRGFGLSCSWCDSQLRDSILGSARSRAEALSFVHFTVLRANGPAPYQPRAKP